MKRTAKTAAAWVGVGLVLAGGAYYWQVKHSPAAIAQAVVKARLNDPDSAVFRNQVKAKRGGEGVWCGEVNARNRMGGMIGFTRYVVEVHPNRNLDVLDQVHFDQGDDTFPGKWNLMCEGS